jgi:hypothetical protein
MTQEFRQVILEMHMLAGGSTQSLEGRVTGTKDRDPMPSGEPHPLYDEFEARWRAARTVGAKQAVLEAARDALKEFRVQKAGVVVEPGTLAWRREIANRDEPNDYLVRIYGVSRQTLWKYRRDYREEAA